MVLMVHSIGLVIVAVLMVIAVPRIIRRQM